MAGAGGSSGQLHPRSEDKSGPEADVGSVSAT